MSFECKHVLYFRLMMIVVTKAQERKNKNIFNSKVALHEAQRQKVFAACAQSLRNAP